MRTIRRIAELRTALSAPRRAGRSIGLVPTMGAFHEGHLSLIRGARAQCDEVVVSLFVNPTQFTEAADLAAYPRDEGTDAAIAAELGVSYLFAPSPTEIYPPGFATTVSVAGLSESLEGVVRGREHFDGVATVVAKLLNIVAPDAAFFGQKDAQQVAVIRRLVRDLDIPSRIEVLPTVRDRDGLALSSRNAHLTPADRARAAVLHRALEAVRIAIAAGERDPARAARAGLDELAAAEIDADYLELVAADTLAPLERIDGDVLVLIAARLGATRLIDNQLLGTGGPPGASTHNGRPSVQRTMLKSKIHRATVTDSDLHYVGSITIDPDLLQAADIREFEQVAVVDVNNGARFETYTISGERGSGEIKINGAAARLVHTGDVVIVISYAGFDEQELQDYNPRVVHVDANNQIMQVDSEVATLWAPTVA